MNWEQLKQAVRLVIKQNGNNEITGKVMQDTLLTTINNIGAGRTFAGFATPETNPGTPDGNVVWFATQEGIYPNFGAIRLTGRKLFFLTNTAAGWQSTAVDIGADVKLAVTGSAIAHYAKAGDINLETAESGWYLTDTGSSAQHKRGITIVASGIIVNDLDVGDNDIYITTTDGHFWIAPPQSAKWSDLGALGGTPGTPGEDGKDADYYQLSPIEELLPLDNAGYVNGTLNYKIYHVTGNSRLPISLSDSAFWRWKYATEGTGIWHNVKQEGGVNVIWNTATNASAYVLVELVIDGTVADSRTVNATPGKSAYNDVVKKQGELSVAVSNQDAELGNLKTSQLQLSADMAAMSSRMGKTEAKVATSVQYDKNTGRITSNVTIFADQIDLEGEVTANGEFAIDSFGNIKTGVALSPSAGAVSYIVEDKSNLVFEDNITIKLPNDPEYIGRRLLIIAQPKHNSAGVILKPGTNDPITAITQTGKITIEAGRTLNNWIYGYDNGASIYTSANDTSDADAVKSALEGLQYFGGNSVSLSGSNFVLARTLSIQCGYIELLGIPYAVNNMFAAKSPVKGGEQYAVHMTRSDDGLIDDTDTVNGIIDVTPTTEADSPTFGQPNSPWREITQLCQWVVVNANAKNYNIIQ